MNAIRRLFRIWYESYLRVGGYNLDELNASKERREAEMRRVFRKNNFLKQMLFVVIFTFPIILLISFIIQSCSPSQ